MYKTDTLVCLRKIFLKVMGFFKKPLLSEISIFKVKIYKMIRQNKFFKIVKLRKTI